MNECHALISLESVRRVPWLDIACQVTNEQVKLSRQPPSLAAHRSGAHGATGWWDPSVLRTPRRKRLGRS